MGGGARGRPNPNPKPNPKPKPKPKPSPKPKPKPNPKPNQAREGDFRFMGLWLRLGRPLDDIEGRGETLLIAAVGVGQHVMLAFLLQARAWCVHSPVRGVACAWRTRGVCARRVHGMFGVCMTCWRVCKLTLRAPPAAQIGASPATEDAKGYTALHHACSQGKVGAVELLLRHNAPLDAQAHS